MLMQDTPIKVFDDSLSAVDMETDAKIRQSIKENVHGTTIRSEEHTSELQSPS